MSVATFMIPKEKVLTCTKWDPIEKVMDIILDDHSLAVVVMGEQNKPVGIVTKRDVVRAYHDGVNHLQRVGCIMSKNLETLLETDSRDHAASLFQDNGHHHLVVVTQDGCLAGLINAWDILEKVAHDSTGLPWMSEEVNA